MKKSKIIIIIIFIVAFGIGLRLILPKVTCKVLDVVVRNIGSDEDIVKQKMKKKVEKVSGYEIEIETIESEAGMTALAKTSYYAKAKIKQTGEEFDIYYNNNEKKVKHNYINKKNKTELENRINNIMNSIYGLDIKYEIIYQPFEKENVWDFTNFDEYLKNTRTYVSIDISNVQSKSDIDKIIVLRNELDKHNIKYEMYLEKNGRYLILDSYSETKKDPKEIMEKLSEF